MKMTMKLLLVPCATAILFPMLKNKEPECFVLNIPEGGVKTLGSFEILGSPRGVSIIMQKNGVTVWESKATASGLIEVKDEAGVSGKHDLCFRSTYNGDQQFAFNLHYDKSGKKVVTTSHTEKVKDLVNQLQTKCSLIADQQAYAISREDMHRNTAESTNSRIVWWTLAEVLCLILLSIFQVYYLKSFFEVKIHV